MEQKGKRAEQHKAHGKTFPLSACQAQAKRKCSLSENKNQISLYNKQRSVIKSLSYSAAYV